MNQHLSSDTETNSETLQSTPVRIAEKVAYIYLVLGIIMAAVTGLLLIIGVIRFTGSNWTDWENIITGIFACLFGSLFFYLIVELFKILSKILAALIEIKDLLPDLQKSNGDETE